MSIKTSFKLFILFGFLLIAVFGYYFLLYLPQKNLSLRPMTSKPTFYYSDEPKIASTSSISPWVTPKKPEIISVSKGSVLNKSSIDKIWKDNPSLNLAKTLKENKIDQKYYSYFYDNAELPLTFSKADLNNDGILDDYFVSIGVGCVSCHSDFITIFVNNKIYTTETDEGYLKPRSDKNGFYLTNQMRNLKTPMSNPPNAIEIDRFQWNGNGFSGVAVRTVSLR